MTEHEQMIGDCETRESKLSDWERGFVASIGEQEAGQSFNRGSKRRE